MVLRLIFWLGLIKCRTAAPFSGLRMKQCHHQPEGRRGATASHVDGRQRPRFHRLRQPSRLSPHPPELERWSGWANCSLLAPVLCKRSIWWEISRPSDSPAATCPPQTPVANRRHGRGVGPAHGGGTLKVEVAATVRGDHSGGRSQVWDAIPNRDPTKSRSWRVQLLNRSLIQTEPSRGSPGADGYIWSRELFGRPSHGAGDSGSLCRDA